MADNTEKQIKEALNALKEKEEAELYEQLIAEQDISESSFAEIALEKRIFYPATLYKDATPRVRDTLLGLLEEEYDNIVNINNILLALATIGDEVVVDIFQKWKENPPLWRKELCVDPIEYAFEGGWCMEDGVKKELTYHTSYALEEVAQCEAEKNVFGGLSEDECPQCGAKYVDILVLDGKDERLDFLGINGKIKIKTCMNCLPWEEYILCKYEEDGESKVIAKECACCEEPEEEDWDIEKYFILSKEPVAKYFCSDWWSSAIGGMPTYVDDAKYVICPECGKRMKHLAQLGGQYTEYGNIYVQICKKCKMVVTLYQQS